MIDFELSWCGDADSDFGVVDDELLLLLFKSISIFEKLHFWFGVEVSVVVEVLRQFETVWRWFFNDLESLSKFGLLFKMEDM